MPESASADPGGAIDSPGLGGSPRAHAERRPRVLPRIAARPRPTLWGDDELLTLPEAAALFWPAGPITVHTLRTAARDGVLAITVVATKHFTTPLAIRRMGAREAAPERPDPVMTAAEEALDRLLERAGRRDRRKAARAG